MNRTVQGNFAAEKPELARLDGPELARFDQVRTERGKRERKHSRSGCESRNVDILGKFSQFADFH